MNKFLVIVVAFMLIGLVGCGDMQTEVEVENGLGQIEVSNIDSITLKVDGNPSVEITEISSLERFVQAIEAAEYTIAQLDIAPSDYGTTVEMKDGTSYKFSFWVVGDYNGLFIKSGQNGHYRLPDGSKKDLLNLFQSASNR